MDVVRDEKTAALVEFKIRNLKQAELIIKLESFGYNDTMKKQMIFDEIQENYRAIKHLKIMYDL